MICCLLWLIDMTAKALRANDARFAMNGQNGKFVGDLPVDKKAANRWMLLSTVAIAAVAYGISWLLWLARIL